MAEAKSNDLTRGLSGKLGKDIVFMQRFGKTIATRSKPKPEGPGSVKQQNVKKKFEKAAAYANGIRNKPDQKLAYSDLAKSGVSFFTRAVGDFMKAPEVREIDTRNYKGEASDTLIIYAKDDFKVTRVKVSIHSGDGLLVEEGDAIQNGAGAEWLYAVTGENEQANGSKIRATAYDTPGNSGFLEADVIL